MNANIFPQFMQLCIPLFFTILSFPLVAQNVTEIRGTVLDSSDEPLAGVTISVVGTTKGVITDIDGTYSIEVAPSDQLQFSYV